MDSLATVLSQELKRFNKLLMVMKKSLVELGKAIRGEVLMDDTLDHMYTCFLVNKVNQSYHIQFNSTQLNSTQLNSTQLNSTQLN